MKVFIVKALAVRPGSGAPAVSSTCVTEYQPDATGLVAYAERAGVRLTLDVEEVSQLGGDGREEIADWIDKCVDVDPAPVVARDRTTILIDELTRGMRNQERRVNQIADSVEKLAVLMATMVSKHANADERNRAQDDFVASHEHVKPAPTIDWNALDLRKNGTETVAGEVVHAERRFAPRAPAIEHGASSIREALDENRTPNANRVVPGNMALRGASASSEIVQVGLDAEGKPTLQTMPLPKVGDSLKPKIGGGE